MPALTGVPTHALVHDGYEIMSLLLALGLGKAFRHLHFREENPWCAPGIAVLRRLIEGVRGRHVLILGIAEIVDMEQSVPISHHGLVVVSPSVAVRLRGMLAIGSQYLNVVHTHHRAQASVVAIGVAQRRAGIVNFLRMEQALQDGFVCHEDGAVLVQIGHDDLIADILKRNKVLGEMCTEILEAIAVIVYQPAVLKDFVNPTLHLGRSRAFHHLASEGL